MPVVMVQKELRSSKPDTLEVMVDDRCAVENITRFAGSQGYSVKTETLGTEYRLTLSKQ